MMRRMHAMIVAGLATAVAAAGGAAAQEPAAFAVAVLHEVDGSGVEGVAQFRQVEDGVRVSSAVTGLTPGRHAYHVHLYGDCSEGASSAGTHFNFSGSSEQPPETIDRITGNLGELVATEAGDARHVGLVRDASLHGPRSILARAVVVHRSGNDPEHPPLGAAGPGVACGVIGISAGPDG